MTRALLLDLDNTLIDRDAAFRAWIASIGALDSAELVALDRGGYGDKRDLFTALGRALEITPQRARTAYADGLPRFVTLKGDAAALLDAFDGVKVIVTNGDSRLQRAKIHAAGLDGRVNAVIVSSELGHDKPSARIFRHALALAGVAPGDARMIGDHPVNDIAGARAIGVEAWMMRTRWFDVPEGVRSIARLDEALG